MERTDSPSKMPEAGGPAAPGRLYHVARDEEYLRLLKAEEEYWDRTPFRMVDSDEPPPPPLRRHVNEQLTGDSETEWFDLIPRYGSFSRGLVLGTGNLQNEAAILRSNPSLHLTFADISDTALARRQRELSPRFPGRVATEQVDLNFIELPRNGYDLIVSDSCIHHLLNLEHVAAQINEALAPESYFFYHDYVGEARLQFSEEKKRLFEGFLRTEQARHPALRLFRPAWTDPAEWNHSPLEAIRSDETLGIFERSLEEVYRSTALPLGALWIFLRPSRKAFHALAARSGVRARLRPVLAPVRRLLGRQLDPDLPSLLRWMIRKGVLADLLLLDRLVSDAGLLRPWRGFAIYRKRSSGEPG